MQKLKSKIVAKEFVEFSTLFPTSHSSYSPVNVEYNSETVNSRCTPTKSKDPGNINEWQYLFHIYVCVFVWSAKRNFAYDSLYK